MVDCAYSQWQSTVKNHLPANEKRHYAMSLFIGWQVVFHNILPPAVGTAYHVFTVFLKGKLTSALEW